MSVIHRREGHGAGLTQLGPLGELAELAGRVLSHTDRRQLSAADPQAEIDALLATVERSEAGADVRAGRSRRGWRRSRTTWGWAGRTSSSSTWRHGFMT